MASPVAYDQSQQTEHKHAHCTAPARRAARPGASCSCSLRLCGCLLRPVVTAPTLAGRVAIITGASSGIGAATARLFAKAGAKLVLSGRDEKRLNAVVAEIAATGAKVVSLIGDAGSEQIQKGLVDLALKTYGALHIAFNNAGAVSVTSLEAITEADVNKMLDSNLKSVIYGLKYQLPAMAKSASKDNWAVIINNSSVLSTRIKSPAVNGMAVYAATKSAVDTLTRFGALEGAAGFTRVLAINPGFTGSEGAQDAFGGADAHTQMNAVVSLVPDPATTSEIAQSVLFLADAKTGRFFNGATIVQDGGFGVK